MKSCSTNDVKIYNLSAQKTLPDWISTKKRKQAEKKDVDLRRRIELIQDFEMPGVSTNIQLSPDGDYILATGIYKPRVRCYDVKNLSMKFERCFDSEIVKFLILSQDYSKLVFLQCDRYVEFHAQYGKYFRLRIPKFGRDLAYHTPSCDLYVVGTTNEAFRLNLELGRFMTPLETGASCINKVTINPIHHLITFGTQEGTIEAWDPRSNTRAGLLDVGLNAITEDTEVNGIPSVTGLKFKDGITLGVGTATGQVLLYDIRSSKPLIVKDHFYSLPITNIEFFKEENLVYSMDSKIVKIWNQSTGEPFTAVEDEADFNDLCVVPNTGMFFVAAETKKMLSYYIPSIGPAPRWCSFLDNLTEELEETDIQTVYDDFKFVTEAELHEIGFGHLIGTNLLRAYMHGYFMDMRLYRKAKAASQPFEIGEFKKKKIQEKLQEERDNRVKISKLPKVNKDLALKFINQPPNTKAKSKSGNLLEDDRFKAMFENTDFQIDKTTEEYRLLNPVLSKMERRTTQKLESSFTPVGGQEDEEEPEGRPSSEDDMDESSSDDERNWVQEVRNERRKLKQEAWRREREEKAKPEFYEIKTGSEFKVSDLQNERKKLSKISLEERVQQEESTEIKARGPLGSRELSFRFKSKRKDFRESAQQHHEERRKIRRSAGGLKGKKSGGFRK